MCCLGDTYITAMLQLFDVELSVIMTIMKLLISEVRLGSWHEIMSFLDGTYIIAMLQLSDVEISVRMTLKNTSLTTILLCSWHELMCCLDGMG